VCEGGTGHAEVVRIEFDPKVISYREILEVFFAVHDPTTLNRQGGDVGEQYRSVIFHHSEAQATVANDVIREAQDGHDDEIVTQLLPAADYWRAETYHQEYFRHNPAQGYCMKVVAPKVEKFRRTFAARRKARPA
jgi:peptide-methionine (S)-S-oxide reductase